ncbi:ubiquinol-cytochrome C chaperone-domain-containing protein [Pseudomassariella vexata]|uniref:Ubiquinol-cytochrome C chaperone-domain-containing protein n=1 Tax=Pseudomassariella vexata TaxID=1141098 RepID=A0A1Y2EDQ4_9PEZI|nr:ubiquinol-cytochrome C chaperone-domain-containing protein [Pseudomassariella vexata]ORY69702.1 ubiquinol-cytochrome C chaperone-domain-containing protein [Pseudomassariella vexata]
MACRSCKRHFSQMSRQAQAFSISPTESQSIILIARHLTHRQVAPQIQQRRRFGATPYQKGWVPQSVKDLAGKALQSTAQPYLVLRTTETVYKACASEAAYTIAETDKRNGTVQKTDEGEEIGKGDTMWHSDFNLLPTFSTWSQVTMLHMYLILARIRNLDRDTAKQWQQQLVDHFFFDAEERMDVVHGISSRGLRHKYLKDLFIQWRGLIAAYDEGIIKSDTVLAAAVWRNIYKAREDVDVRSLASIVSWMRLCLKMLDQMPDEALFTRAQAAFKWPAKNELQVVDQPCRELAAVLPKEIPQESVLLSEEPVMRKQAA